MMLGTAGTVAFLDYKVTRDEGSYGVARAMLRIAGASNPEKTGLRSDGQDDFDLILRANVGLGQDLLRTDNQVVAPFMSHDREKTVAALKSYLGKTSFGGIVTLVDEKGLVFYSSDTPNTSNYSIKSNPAFQPYFDGRKHGAATTPALFTKTQTLTLTGLVPIETSKGLQGIVAVSTPVDAEFISGVVEKMAITPPTVTGLEVVLLDPLGMVTAITPGLAQGDNSFVKELKESKGAALPSNTDFLSWLHSGDGFERAGRWWKVLTLRTTVLEPINGKPQDGPLVGYLVLSKDLPNLLTRLQIVVALTAAFGGIGIILAMVFSSGIGRSVNKPLKFLIRRTEQIASQRAALQPLEGLTGDWLALGEQIDTAVTAMRSTVQSLKTQLARQQHESHESSRESDDVTVQIEQMNRQFAIQSKQLNDLSRQLNTASRQAILLQHKLDTVLQVSTEGYLILDGFGNVLSANPVFLNWLGANEGEIAGRLCFDLIQRPGEPPNSANEGEPFARHGGDPHALINQFYPEGVVYHRFQQRAVEVMAHLQPVVSEDSQIQGYIMVLRDKSVSSEIAQLRGEIVSMLSESIRAPLSAAENAWATVLNNAAQTMHPSVGQPLAELHGHYEKMLGVVDSLLMMYGGFVPPAATPKEQVVITRLVADCLEEVAPLARNYQLALDYRSSPLPNVSLNKEGVRATLINVLQRMITLTAPGGRVRVETTLKGQELRLGVQSSGPALSESEIGDLFAGFIEGKHDESTYSARLSMYLARNTVERFGGKIWAESESGRGTIVYFTIPVQVVAG